MSRVLSGRNSGQYFVQVTAPATHACEHIFIETIEADRHPLQARICQLRGGSGKQHAVRCQRQVFDGRHVGQSADELRDVFVQQRLTARQSNLADAKAGSRTHHPNYFVISQSLLFLQKLVLGMKFGFRHTIRTTQIALIEQRNAQIV